MAHPFRDLSLCVVCLWSGALAALNTCGDVKSAYKTHGCCGYPDKSFVDGSLTTTCKGVKDAYKSQSCCGDGTKAFERNKKTNIVFLLIDDLGFNDFVESEQQHVSWPHMKSLLSQSVLINTTYTEPFCTPSRATFLTGRYKNLVGGSAGGKKQFSSTEEVTLPQRLNAAGYMSYGIGKWDLGWEQWAVTPIGRGFHRYIGSASNNEDHYTHCQKDHYSMNYMENVPFDNSDSSESNPYFLTDSAAAGVYSSYVYGAYAQRFLHDHKRLFPLKPFFLYFAIYAVHTPYQAPEEVINKLCLGIENEWRRTICGMQALIDETIANLTTTLTQTYALDDYVFIVTGDNGGMIGHEGKAGWGNNEPLRGKKFGSFEGGVRSHAAVWGKHPDLASSAMKGQKYTGGFMHLVDWHATIAELAGAAPIDDMSGSSVWHAILNNGASPRTELLISSGYGDFYRRGNWKLINAKIGYSKGWLFGSWWPLPGTEENYTQYAQSLGGIDPAAKQTLLFNVAEDPDENEPVPDADMVAEFQAAIANWTSKGRHSVPTDAVWTCANQTCADEKNAAMPGIVQAWAAPLADTDVPCKAKVYYPYWDATACPC